MPIQNKDCKHVYHLFVVITLKRRFNFERIKKKKY